MVITDKNFEQDVTVGCLITKLFAYCMKDKLIGCNYFISREISWKESS